MTNLDTVSSLQVQIVVRNFVVGKVGLRPVVAGPRALVPRRPSGPGSEKKIVDAVAEIRMPALVCRGRVVVAGRVVGPDDADVVDGDVDDNEGKQKHVPVHFDFDHISKTSLIWQKKIRRTFFSFQGLKKGISFFFQELLLSMSIRDNLTKDILDFCLRCFRK